MVTTIKERVIVEAGGRVAVQSAHLREGESAEVIILVDRPVTVHPQERLDSLRQLRQRLNLPLAGADQWAADLKAERNSRRVPGVDK